MSIRLYIGNLPQTFEEQELVALLKSVGEGTVSYTHLTLPTTPYV